MSQAGAQTEKREWVKITITQPVEEIRKFGPSIPIKISSVDGLSSADVAAQIDTGAGHSCISPTLFKRLGLAKTGTAEQHAAGFEPQNVPICEAQILLPSGTKFKSRSKKKLSRMNRL